MKTSDSGRGYPERPSEARRRSDRYWYVGLGFGAIALVTCLMASDSGTSNEKAFALQALAPFIVAAVTTTFLPKDTRLLRWALYMCGIVGFVIVWLATADNMVPGT